MKKIELTGMKFGKLTVTGEAYRKNNKIYWHCKCECGNTCITDGAKLRQVKKTHCGCVKPKMPSNYKDLTGIRFGMLTVVKRVDKPAHLKKEGVYWLCQCDCGNEHIVLTCNLNNGHTTNCGCVKRKNTSERFLRDLSNLRFGRLTVIKREENYISPNGNTNTRWLCLCDCGKYVTVTQCALTSGDTQSCGCLFKEKASERFLEVLAGQRFGKLTVLKRVKNLIHPNGLYSVQWLCRCDCGNETIVTSGNLKNGHTSSCGCISSKNEMLIGNILNAYHIEYKPQYTFEDCKDVGLLRFDYGLLCNGNLLGVIEYDGEQHFMPVKYYSMSDEEANFNLKETQRRDNIKNEYCFKNSIPLLRIPYWDRDNIEEIIYRFIKELGYLEEFAS